MATISRAWNNSQLLHESIEYEIIDSQQDASRRVGYNHVIPNKREWNNCFIKSNPEILLYLADFSL